LLSQESFAAMKYSVHFDHVHTQDKPHDCEFEAAPLGKKYCAYVKKDAKVGGEVYITWDRVDE